MPQKLKSQLGLHRINKDHEKRKELMLYLVGKLRKIIFVNIKFITYACFITRVSNAYDLRKINH